MHGDFQIRDDEFDLAGSGPSSPRSAAAEPVKIGDIVAVLISDLGVRRIAAPVDQPRDERYEVPSRVSVLRAR